MRGSPARLAGVSMITGAHAVQRGGHATAPAAAVRAEEAAVQRPGTKMGGREEEERSPGISGRKPDRLHGRKTDWTPGATPGGKLAL